MKMKLCFPFKLCFTRLHVVTFCYSWSFPFSLGSVGPWEWRPVMYELLVISIVPPGVILTQLYFFLCFLPYLFIYFCFLVETWRNYCSPWRSLVCISLLSAFTYLDAYEELFLRARTYLGMLSLLSAHVGFELMLTKSWCTTFLWFWYLFSFQHVPQVNSWNVCSKALSDVQIP